MASSRPGPVYIVRMACARVDAPKHVIGRRIPSRRRAIAPASSTCCRSAEEASARGGFAISYCV
eukprot:2936752-Pyramimonas_sp.AAC.1